MQPLRPTRDHQSREAGFMLAAVIVMIFLVFLALSVAAPRIAKQIKHDREVESEHRAQQYVRAIQLYYRKNNSQYPASIDALKKTNNVRFLRQEYKDPLTGQADWRLIHVGQNKTTVKDFFGEEFKAPATGGLGSAAGMASTGMGQTVSGSSTPGFGSSSGSLSGSSFGSSTPLGSGFGGASGTASGTGTSQTGTSTSGGLTSTDATQLKGTGGPIMGIGSSKSGAAVLVVNESTTYEDWEFLYDPRTDIRKAKVNILGGGISSTGSSSLGSLGGSASPTSPTTPTAPVTPTPPQQ